MNVRKQNAIYCGVGQLVTHQAHNLKIASSNLASATFKPS